MKKTSKGAADLHQTSKFIEVLGSKIHYIDEGEGDPILFLHGFPASSYTWRNVISQMKNYGRCIAPDLIGMGQSDKPDIYYSLTTHCEYINAFIQKLNLRNITLVLHGFGSIMGMSYAMLHGDNIKGIALYEVHLCTNESCGRMCSLPVQHLLSFVMREPAFAYKAIVENNFVIKRLLGHVFLDGKNSESLDHYEQPYKEKSQRKALWDAAQEFAKINDHGSEAHKLIDRYSRYLQMSDVPKLLLYTVPGFNTTVEAVQWVRDNVTNIEVVEIGEGCSFVQETDPQRFTETLKKWYLRI